MKPKTKGPSLFDVIEIAEAKEDPKNCKHRHERRTETIWEGETFTRLTMTCEACNHVRGRFPGE